MKLSKLAIGIAVAVLSLSSLSVYPAPAIDGEDGSGICDKLPPWVAKLCPDGV